MTRQGKRLLFGWLAGVFLAGAAGAAPAAAQPGPADGPHTVVVKMVDKSATQFVFEPAEITVRPGDTVRWIQTGAVPHNVEFKKVPKGTDLGEQRMGPFLLGAGETYEVVIDERFAPGLHRYVCTPHEAMGMVGSLTVSKPAEGAERKDGSE